MPDKVLVQIQRVQRLRIKARQHHIDYKKDVHLRKILLLHTLGDVLPVRIEILNAIGSAKHAVIIVHDTGEQFCRMLITLTVHVLIGTVTEYGSNLIAICFGSCRVQFLEYVIILSEGLDGIHGKQSRIDVLALRMYMLFMMLKDMFCNLTDTLIVMIQVINVDVMTLAVLRIVQLFRVNALHSNVMSEQSTLILDREAEDVSICNGILNHVAVQAGITLGTIRHQACIEYVSSRSAVSTLVGLKDRRSREADIIGSLEVAFNISVHLTELGAVTFINDEDHLFVSVRVH